MTTMLTHSEAATRTHTVVRSARSLKAAYAAHWDGGWTYLLRHCRNILPVTFVCPLTGCDVIMRADTILGRTLYRLTAISSEESCDDLFRFLATHGV